MARRAFRAASLAAVCLLAALSASNACIYLFGSSPDSIAAHPAGTPWNHGFLGDDWEGADGAGKPWVCKTGKKQSPINVRLTQLLGDEDATPVPPAHQTKWSYPDLISNGSNIEVINNGHTIQVEWRSNYAARVRIPIPAKPTNTTPITAVLSMQPTDKATYAEAVPLQFHLHSHSEHTVDGQQYPLELHIVHRITDPKLPACAGGCFAVIGLLFELSDGPDNALLRTIWDNMPMREGQILRPKAGSRISLGRLLPAAAERNYVTYEGSLTTPPCSEGLLWHVLTKPQKISLNQWRKYLRAVGLKDCTSTKNGTAPHSNRRALLAGEGAGNPDDYNCTVGAYGFNYRTVQPVNGRVVRSARVYV